MAKTRQEVIAELRRQLLLRRDAIRRALQGDLAALAELREMSGDEADFAAGSSSSEINSQLAEVESREIQQIDNALARMEAGTYGICEVTGKQIPLPRLEALPYATTTIEAQRMLESGSARPESAPDWSRMLDTSSDDVSASINDIEYL